MKNVTITLDEDTLRWARLEAAGREISVSALIRDLLRDHLQRSEGYEAAMARFLSVSPGRLKERGSYPIREEIHDRARLR